MTPQNLRAAKQRLRKSILETRNAQPLKLVEEKSEKIFNLLINMDEYKNANVIMLYSGKGMEVQTEQLIRTALKEKRVVLPITNVKKRILELSEIKDYDLELEIGTFNVLEPKPELIRPIGVGYLDLIVVPGVAFDYYGNRLGYGHAYYDKLLQSIRRPIPLIGLAFQFQVKKRIPRSRYDIPVHYLVTEMKIFECR